MHGAWAAGGIFSRSRGRVGTLKVFAKFFSELKVSVLRVFTIVIISIVAVRDLRRVLYDSIRACPKGLHRASHRGFGWRVFGRGECGSNTRTV